MKKSNEDYKMKIKSLNCFLGLITAAGIFASGCGANKIESSNLQTQPSVMNAAITMSSVETDEVVTTTPVKKQESTFVMTSMTPLASPSIVSASETNFTTTKIVLSSDSIQTIMSKMKLKDKICQMFIVTPEGLTGYNGSVTMSGDLTKESIEKYPVGGVIYFADNLEDAPQTYQMLSDIQNYSREDNGIGLFLAVDEEGGTVARVADSLKTTAFYDMEFYGEKHDSEEAYAIGNIIGNDIKTFGFNVDFAPVADVNINPENELGSRIFSDDPYVVSDMVSGVVKGLEDSGVCATLKHFPGLGAGDGNTHNDDFVFIDRTYQELMESEFVAFRGGISAGSDFVMVGHQITSASGDDLPGDLSYTVVTQWLRNTLGFNGIAITDAQNMAAITQNYTPGDAAVASIQAGMDIILMPMDLSNAINGVYEAVKSGKISEARINESVYKILSKKNELGLLGTEEDLKNMTNTTTAETTLLGF